MVAALFMAANVCFSPFPSGAAANEQGSGAAAASAPPEAPQSITLSDAQLQSVRIEAAGTHGFRVEVEAVGSIAYHEKDTVHNARLGDTSKFVVANIRESDSTLVRAGQPVRAKVMAYPDRVFEGRVSVLGITVYDSGGNPAVDPNTHRVTARCEIADPKNELYPGMLATVVIGVGKPMESAAIPQNGVVRESDGTMTAWVTTDGHSFTRRPVSIGLREDGYAQVLEGLHPGERVATDGAIFISNMLNALPSE